MNDWYFYHSAKTMGHSYASMGTSTVYRKSIPSKICYKDRIWVVEGDVSNPRKFYLVDCFEFVEIKHKPFSEPYSKFEFQIIGTSLFKAPILLNKDDEWFSILHNKYITKQRFFCPISNMEPILEGLRKIASI